jgi:hypothetical protein
MTNKLNVAKIGWFFLIAINIFLFYALITSKTGIGKMENPPLPTTVIEAYTKETYVNNVNMSLISAHTEGTYGYRVELCYNLPNQRDWMLTHSGTPSGTNLIVGDVTVSPIEEGTMYWKYDEQGMVMQRCQYLLFKISIPPQADMVFLKVETLYTKTSGQSDLCLETMQKMAERNSKIEIDCMKMNVFEGFVYTKFPVELLTMDPVYKRIFKDMNWDYYHGPWSFTFPVNPD